MEMRKENVKKKKGEKLVIPQEKEEVNKVFSQIIGELLFQEKERGESIQRQTARLPVFQTLFFTALYTVLPTLLDNFVEKKIYIWWFTTVISLLGIVSLMFTLFSQWRFRSKDKITVENVENYIKDYRDKQSEIGISIEVAYKINASKERLKEVQRINKYRSFLLTVAMNIFLITIMVTIVFIIILCI